MDSLALRANEPAEGCRREKPPARGEKVRRVGDGEGALVEWHSGLASHDTGVRHPHQERRFGRAFVEGG
jgi:hypothetical protein